MSRCIECLQEMDPVEARFNLVCRQCRSREGGSRPSQPIRDLSTRGTEESGRSQISTQVLGGTCDVDEDPEFSDEE